MAGSYLFRTNTTPGITLGNNTYQFSGSGALFTGSWDKYFLKGNHGTATLANGNTTIVVTHNMTNTPLVGEIQVTPIETLASASFWWVDTITATQFTINVDTNPTQDVDFAWQIKVD